MRIAAVILGFSLLLGAEDLVRASDDSGKPLGAHAIAAGSYCRLPEPGEKPACLEPARASYGEFFAAVDGGSVQEETLREVEADLVAKPGSPDAYLALSSLAYGYMRIARSTANSANLEPLLASRLERWNELLSAVYANPGTPQHFHNALRNAAEDIHGHTGVPLSEKLLIALGKVDRAGGRGLRDPLRQVIDRIRGTEVVA